MNSIFTYILLGVSLAAPIGPVNAAQLDKGIKNGFIHAWIFGIGALAADVIYMFLVYFGVVHFIESSFMKTFLFFFGFFVLMYTGIESLLTAKNVDINIRNQWETPLVKSFISGFLMSLLNPLTILFWLGIYGSILAKTSEVSTDNQLTIYSISVISGIILWDLIMAIISGWARRFLSKNFLMSISTISSLAMIGFGIYFGIQAFKSLFS